MATICKKCGGLISDVVYGGVSRNDCKNPHQSKSGCEISNDEVNNELYLLTKLKSHPFPSPSKKNVTLCSPNSSTALLISSHPHS